MAQRNLHANGGWLDEVLWVANTDNKDDLRYLDDIIKSNPMVHRKLEIPGEKLWVYSYYKIWQRLERGKYYVKIDDDIVSLGIPNSTKSGKPVNKSSQDLC